MFDLQVVVRFPAFLLRYRQEGKIRQSSPSEFIKLIQTSNFKHLDLDNDGIRKMQESLVFERVVTITKPANLSDVVASARVQFPPLDKVTWTIDDALMVDMGALTVVIHARSYQDVHFHNVTDLQTQIGILDAAHARVCAKPSKIMEALTMYPNGRAFAIEADLVKTQLDAAVRVGQGILGAAESSRLAFKSCPTTEDIVANELPNDSLAAFVVALQGFSYAVQCALQANAYPAHVTSLCKDTVKDILQQHMFVYLKELFQHIVAGAVSNELELLAWAEWSKDVRTSIAPIKSLTIGLTDLREKAVGEPLKLWITDDDWQAAPTIVVLCNIADTIGEAAAVVNKPQDSAWGRKFLEQVSHLTEGEAWSNAALPPILKTSIRSWLDEFCTSGAGPPAWDNSQEILLRASC